MNTIVSRNNAEIQLVAALHKEKNRSMHKLFIAEGLRACPTLIEAGNIPQQLYVTEALLFEAQAMVDDTLITIVTDPVMEKISTTKTPSGLLGVFHMPTETSLDNVTSGLVLAQIADPGNMGTLIRSAAAMNCGAIVIVEGTDPWSSKVVQASAGTIGTIPIIQTSWDTLLKHRNSYKLCAMVVKGGKSSEQLNFTNTLLVVGNEAHGLPDAWIKNCDTHMTIAMPGNTESLNAATAGSIALYLAFVHKKS